MVRFRFNVKVRINVRISTRFRVWISLGLLELG